MVRVAGQGLFDFSEFDPRNKLSWTRLKLTLREAAHQAELRLCDMIHQQVIQQLSNAGLTKESLEKSWDSGIALYNHSKALRLPWIKEETVSAAQKFSAEEAWGLAYGDPNDPVVQAKIEATARWLESK